MNIIKTLIKTGVAASILVFAAGGAFAQPPGFPGFDFGGGGGGRGGGDRGGGGDNNNDGPSQTANAAVTAVADERSNSVIISAPEELWPMIEELIAEMDGILERTADVQVFPLRYANPEEMADLVENLFEENSGGGRGGRGGFAGFGRASTTAIETTAEADERTNSVIVSADRDKMPLISAMIQKLDQDPAREQKLHIYEIKNGDAEAIQLLLQNMVQQQGGGGGAARGNTAGGGNNSAFQQRGNTGGGGGFGGGGGGFGGGGGGFGGGGGNN